MSTMKVTYEDEGYTCCVYLRPIGRGAGDIMNADIAVDFDEEQQIIAFRLFESEEYKFKARLKYIRENPHTDYDENTRTITVSFVERPEPKKSIAWHADIDLDEAGQIVGLEMLFASPGWKPDDGQERVYAAGALKHLSKFRVRYDELD